MTLLYPLPPLWLAAGLRLTLTAWLALLLCCSPTLGQSGRPPALNQTAASASPGQGVMGAPLKSTQPEDTSRNFPAADLKPTPSQGASQTPFELQPVSGWKLAGWRCPLPPASVFAWQTNLRQYLESWPTPGATAGEDWPEYIGESEDNLD
jgi:hypothetical protein